MGKIGIMGGTFDPIHNGHLAIGRQAYQEYGLNQIWYMPSGHPPHKKNHEVTEPEFRLAMTELGIQDHKEFICSDFEIRRNGNTYTAQTLELLSKEYPSHRFYFIIGADSLYDIETWYEHQKVMELAVLLVAPREEQDEDVVCESMEQQIAYLKNRYGADIRSLHCEEINISSSQLRLMIKEGKSIKSYVPPKVAAYIQAHGFYQENEHG